jgi:thymidylate synthase
MIKVSLTHPETGKVLEVFEGNTPKEIYKKIDFSIGSLKPEHAMYIGTELQKAHLCLKSGRMYEQDKEI